MEQLALAFFPTDKPKSIVVNVTYNIAWMDNSAGAIHGKTTGSDSNETDDFYFQSPERILRSANYDTNQSSLSYRWVSSSINMLVNPRLLKKLSLFAFQTEIANLNLNIEVPSGCEMPEVLSKITTCGHDSDDHDMIEPLNQLTSNVSTITTHWHAHYL